MPDTHCGFHHLPQGQAMLTYLGPTLLVNIGFDQNWTLAGGIAPILGVTNVNALVDTGASESFIDDVIAMQLNLPIIDRKPLGGISGQLQAKVYLAQIHIPSLNFTIYGAFAGVHLTAGGQQHIALIGRSFLQRCKMMYNGLTGEVTISM